MTSSPPPLPPSRFRFPVTDGWVRDLASAPSPGKQWPCIAWDDALEADQDRFLAVQAECQIPYHVVWGLWAATDWPLSLASGQVTDAERAARVQNLAARAKERGVTLMTGMGVYSWGFEEIIRSAPGVSAGHPRAMCPFLTEAWDWQRRALDFVMQPEWGLGGISLQSADQGRCDCERCQAVPAMEHHRNLLTRTVEYVRSQRPDWVIGQAAWGLRLDDPADLPALRQIAKQVDYLVEVEEETARKGSRAALCDALPCAFGSVGGVFVEPPQHWARDRWFVPCGLRSAKSLTALYADGGRACEYFFRPFANPGEEVSWRTGAYVLTDAGLSPSDALRRALGAVYSLAGQDLELLADWYTRAEAAYFTRSNFRVGDAPLSLEPLVWNSDDPATPCPPIYLRDRMDPRARQAYADELAALLAEFQGCSVADEPVGRQTQHCLRGALGDLEGLGCSLPTR